MKTFNLNDMPQFQAHLSRHGFNMSQSFGFTSSTGMILPTYYDFLNAGEAVYGSGSLFSRTQPLVTAAMADVDVFLDWFFVPMSMLLTEFPSMRYMTNDLLSSNYIFNQGASGSGLDQQPYTSQSGNFPVINFNSVFNVFSPSAFYTGDGSQDSRFDCLGCGTFRLFNHLGLNPYIAFSSTKTPEEVLEHDAVMPNIFPAYLAAYQCIFHNFDGFRIDSRHRRRVVDFNLDCINHPNTQAGQASTIYNSNAGLYRLRYAPLYRDYFTSVKPAPIISAVNLSGNSGSGDRPVEVLRKINDYFGSNPFNTQNTLGSQVSGGSSGIDLDSITPQAGQAVNGGGAIQFSGYPGNTTNNNLSTANIRQMFAVEKLLRIVGRTRKDYDSQILAHFGFKVPHDVKHEITHIRRDSALLHIGEVTSTADTVNSDSELGGSALGEISGKGYVNIKGKKFKFTAPCDGIIMCLYHCVPRVRYFGTYDKQNNFTSRLDLFTPELDRLGMQPLYVYEAEMGGAGVTSARVGWQYRYEQWKRKYDRVTEAFAAPTDQYNFVNQQSTWMLGRLPFNAASSVVETNLTAADFYCPPTALDNIMVMKYMNVWNDNYRLRPWLMFVTDPFINDFFAEVKKVSVMSPSGEPDLDL